MTCSYAYEIPKELRINFEIFKGERLMLFLCGALLSKINKMLSTAD